MRSLTLTKPWAGLVAAGIKLVENRPRKIIRRANFGELFAIHASREIKHEVYDCIRRISPELFGQQVCGIPVYGGVTCVLPAGHGGHPQDGGCSAVMRPVMRVGDRAFERAPWWKLGRITSAVIAVGVVDRVVFQWQEGDPERMAGYPELAKDQLRWFFGPVGYVLRDVRALSKPVPCRGYQGFWTLPADVEEAVLANVVPA